MDPLHHLGPSQMQAAPLPDVPVIMDPGVFPSAGQNTTSALAVPLLIRNDLAEADDLALFCCLWFISLDISESLYSWTLSSLWSVSGPWKLCVDTQKWAKVKGAKNPDLIITAFLKFCKSNKQNRRAALNLIWQLHSLDHRVTIHP